MEEPDHIRELLLQTLPHKGKTSLKESGVLPCGGASVLCSNFHEKIGATFFPGAMGMARTHYF